MNAQMEVKPNIKQQKSSKSHSVQQEISAVHNGKLSGSINSANNEVVQVSDRVNSGAVPKLKKRNVGAAQSSKVRRSSFSVGSTQEKQNVPQFQDSESFQEMHIQRQTRQVAQRTAEDKGIRRALSLRLQPRDTNFVASDAVASVQISRENSLKAKINRGRGKKDEQTDQKGNEVYFNMNEQGQTGSKTIKNQWKPVIATSHTTGNTNAHGFEVTRGKTTNGDIANNAWKGNDRKSEGFKIVQSESAGSAELNCYSEANINNYNHVQAREIDNENVRKISANITATDATAMNKDQMIFELKKNGYSSPFEECGQASEFIRSGEYLQQALAKNVLHNYEDLHKFISQEIEAELNKNWIQLGEMSSPSSPEDMIHEDNSSRNPESMNMPPISNRENEINRNVILNGMTDENDTMIGRNLNHINENSDEDCSAFITRKVHIREKDQVEKRMTQIRYTDNDGKTAKRARRYISAATHHSNKTYIAPVTEKIKTTRGEKMPRGKKTITIQENIPEEDSSLEGCHVNQTSTCPIYFGVKSYLHQFYDPASNLSTQGGNEYVEVDDFEYLVDPNKSYQQHCCKSLWFRAGIWAGVNLVLIGIIALSFGYLTPEKLVVVGRHENYEVIDQAAIVYNRRLELCRLAGLVVFCCGVGVLFIILLLALLVSTVCPHNNNNFCKKRCTHNTERIVESFSITEESHTFYTEGKAKIPITEQIKQVQPNISTPTKYKGLIRTQ